MSDVEIHYNSGRVPVSGTGPTPYISLSDEVISYGDRWGLANRIVLNGVITGSNFNSLYVAQSGLISLFSTSYKELTVYEGPDGAVGYAGNGGAPNVSYSGVYTFSGCSVDKISFDQAGYNKVVGYSVELLSYPSGLSGFFSGVYGVLDPKDEIRISEGNDGFATISHIVSARGFVTNSIHTAVNNAKNYVASRTGISNILSVPIISGIENTGAFTPVLVSLSENLDNPYAVVSNKYGAPNGLSFCQDPIQFTIEEDLKSRSLKFNASYDNLEFYSSNDKYVFSGCYLDASISHSIDPLSSVDTIQVKGDIKCRGSVTNRYNSSLLYLGQLMTAGSSASYPRMYDFVNDYYSSYYSAGSKFAINSTPTSLIVNANPLLGTISIEATFDNRDRFSSLSASDYSIEYTPYNTIYAYASSCNQPSKHMAVDINIKKREKASINLSVSGPASTEKNLIDAKDTIFTAFVDNFVKGLIVDASSLNTLQIEDSVLSLMNSTTTTPLGTTIGSTINSSKIYSYELKESERALRPVIKSRS